MLPACSACGVDYSEGYDGPCQEWARGATNAQILRGDPPMCPGTVSLAATLERRAEQAEKLGNERATLLDEALNLIEHEPRLIDCSVIAADTVRRGRESLEAA
jgi:hypothetical protein